MGQDVTGKTLARIAVEMGEEEDVRRLVEAGTVDWNEKIQGEDPAIFWALKNERFEMVRILLKCPGIDLKMRDRNNCSLEKNVRFVLLLLTHTFVCNLPISVTECWRERKNIKKSWKLSQEQLSSTLSSRSKS